MRARHRYGHLLFALVPWLGIAAGCSAAGPGTATEGYGGISSGDAGAPQAPAASHRAAVPRARLGVAAFHPEGEPGDEARSRRVTDSNGVSYHGGKVISNVRVIPVFWGSNVNATAQSEIECYYDALTRSPYVDSLSEYDTPTQQIGRGSASAPVTITPFHTGTSLSDGDIQDELQFQILAKQLPQNDANTIYMIYFPPGIGFTSNGGSCVSNGFCAYHSGFTSLFSQNGQPIRYGVFPDYADGSPCATGCGGGGMFSRLGNASAHELAEAITDPDGDGWNGGGNEIGDTCNQQETTLPGTYYTVQNVWSNAHGGCYAPSSGVTDVDPPVIRSVSPSEAAYDASTSVTITGSCFADSSGEVTNGIGYPWSAVTIDSKSFNQLKVTVPSSPSGGVGAGTLSIFNDVNVGPSEVPFTYLPANAATLSPSDGPMQGDTPVTIQGGPFPDTGLTPIGVSFGGHPATQVTCPSSTTCIAYPPAHDPGPVTVTLEVNGVVETVANQYTFDGPQITSVTPSFGSIAGGTTVTVYGTNMADVSEGAFVAQARFGGVTMSVGCARSGQYDAWCTLTSPSLASVPSNPVDIQIEITHTTGTTMWTPPVPADRFTYTLLPAVSSLGFPSYAIGGATATATIELNGDAPSGGSVVSLSRAPGSPAGVVQFPSTVTVPAGSTWVDVPVTVIGQDYTGTVTIVATYGGTSVSGSLDVYPTSAPAISVRAPLCAGRTASGTVMLAEPAPPGGGVIALTSDSGFASVPATVIIPAGATTASFPITIGEPAATQTAHIGGSYDGVAAARATVSLLPASAVWLSVPSVVIAGQPATGSVGVCTAAPAGGTAISLSSSNAAVRVPAGVTIPAGSASAPLPVSAATMTPQTSVITASDGASTTTVTVEAMPLPRVPSPPPGKCLPGRCS